MTDRDTENNLLTLQKFTSGALLLSAGFLQNTEGGINYD